MVLRLVRLQCPGAGRFSGDPVSLACFGALGALDCWHVKILRIKIALVQSSCCLLRDLYTAVLVLFSTVLTFFCFSTVCWGAKRLFMPSRMQICDIPFVYSQPGVVSREHREHLAVPQLVLSHLPRPMLLVASADRPMGGVRSARPRNIASTAYPQGQDVQDSRTAPQAPWQEENPG